MCMVHEILHTMYEIKEGMLYWIIHVVTDTEGKVLDTISILNIAVHEATNPLIEGYYMLFIKFFSYPPIIGAMKSIFQKYVSTSKGEF